MVKTVHITGFGKFNGVDENPTELLVRELQTTPAPDVSYNILCVSTEDANAYIQSIACSHDTICIHLGVHSGADRILLEQCAYNNMTFRVPDEKNYQPSEERINPDAPFNDCLRSEFPLQSIAAALQAENHNVGLSTDPGRFVCNYIYYQSLCHQRDAGNTCHSVFVHVPPLAVMSLEEQLRTVRRCIELLCASV